MIIKICKAAESVFKTNDKILNCKNVIEKLILLTLTELPVNYLFTDVEHAFDQALLTDHRNQLIRIILNKFFTLRLHHYAASWNNNIKRIRSKFTILILFKNQ